MTRRIRDRSVIVIGAASGIGAATACALADAGARVVRADVAPFPVPRSPSTLALYADVSELHTLEALRDTTLRALGSIDVVVNCAGVLVPGPVDRLSPAAIRRQIDVNFLGTVLVTRAFLPYFRQQNSGHLVHVGSLGGIVPLAGEAVYSATKFAVRGFCLALALELKGTGVSVSVICPDSVDTPQLATEAAGHGSAFSFLSEPLRPAQAAGAILDTIGRPRIEVAVPAGRELPAKLLAWSPALLYRLYPLLERWGAARRSRFATRRVSAGPSAASPRPT